MTSHPHIDDDDDFGGDFPVTDHTRRAGTKRSFGDLDDEEDDIFGSKKANSKPEETAPGVTTGMILSLRESLQSCKDDLASCQSELEAAKSEIQKWHPAFQNESFCNIYPLFYIFTFRSEPKAVISYLHDLKSSEESLKDHLEKAKKKEAAFIVTITKREQDISDLKSAVRDLRSQLKPPSMQARRLLLDPAIHEEFTRLKSLVEEKDKKVKELQDNIAAVNFTPQSKMGKMLMGKCRTLQEENEEIGNQAKEGKIHELSMKLALQKSQNLELKNHFEGLSKHMEGLTNEVEKSNEKCLFKKNQRNRTMPPRKGPKARHAPAAKKRTARTGGASTGTTQTPPGGGAASASLLMDAAQVQTLLAQGIATALATFLAAQNENTGNGGANGINSTITRGNARTCTYKDFMACKPPTFKGTEGAVVLSQWIEKMETVFQLCSCPADSQIKFAAYTLLGSALTWWNDHTKSMGLEAAYAMNWDTFKDLVLEEYCPRQEVQALETELWNLKMQGLEISAYTTRFNDLAALCPMMVNPEYRKVERYIGGLAQPVRSLVTASKPTTFDSAKRLAYQLAKQNIQQDDMMPYTLDAQVTGEKRKFQEDSEDEEPESETLAIYAATTNTPNQRKPYSGTLPLCTKCNFHHVGDCRICSNCNLGGHTSKYCRKTNRTK